MLDQLRKEGKLPPAGELATPLNDVSNKIESIPLSINDTDPKIKLNDFTSIPQIGYGIYLIPNNDIGEKSILNAIQSGYRHFDSAEYYGNEIILGNALRNSNIPREEFIINTKVWNDSLKLGRIAVRNSVMNSINNINFGGYIDICYIHWPVPNYYIDAYNELELLYKEGIIRSIGLSNFSPNEYENLINNGCITIKPVVNQLEVSVVMYRPDLINYFINNNIKIVAYKPLNRGEAIIQCKPIDIISKKYSVTSAQIMLRWCIQKGLIVICKTSNINRMKENRSIMHFIINNEDMNVLDSLTTKDDILQREQHELHSKKSL